MPSPIMRATALQAALLLAASIPLGQGPARADATGSRTMPATTAPARTGVPPDVPPDEGVPATAPEAGPVIVLRRGDTLAGRLTKAGVTRIDAHAAGQALAALFRPDRLRPGHRITLRLDPEIPGSLLGLDLEVAPGRAVLVRRGEGGGFAAEEVRTPRLRHLALAEGMVEPLGLFGSLRQAGLPAPLAMQLSRALAPMLDLQRDLRPGDRFAVAFERMRDPEGALLGHGELLHAELVLSGRRIEMWRHAPEGGAADWYDETGRPARPAFLRTPLDGARVTSGFGPRRHPILGYTRMHRALDFAAPTGTPVYAAADGVVISARTERGYGRIVRLRHPNGVETRYAHLSRFARGLRAGQKVRQGQVIGAVGATGLATGPHLHYEVRVAGRAVDPARAKRDVRPEPLRGRALAAFQAERRALRRQLAALGGRDEIALAP
jgi:murein DD-endopeptidase MepM/ murein hydrolase activator NlpD